MNRRDDDDAEMDELQGGQAQQQQPWQQQQGVDARRRVLLALLLGLLAVVVLYDLLSQRSDANRTPTSTADGSGSGSSAAEPPPPDPLGPIMQAVQWERRVHAHERFPDNVTGLFQGAWSMLAEEPASQFVGLPNITVGMVKTTQMSKEGRLPMKHSRGSASLQLYSKPSQVDGVRLALGYLSLNGPEGQSLRELVAPVTGVYIQPKGQLTLFANMESQAMPVVFVRRQGSKYIAFPTAMLESSDERMLLQTDSVGGGDAGDSAGGDVAGMASTGRSLLAQSANCVLQMELRVTPLPVVRPRNCSSGAASSGSGSGSGSGASLRGAQQTAGATEACEDEAAADTALEVVRLQVTGALWSPSCAGAVNLTVSANQLDGERTLSKATHYAIVVAAVSLVQIALVVLQMHFSSTQAAAARVSLLTVGQQAIMDSYQCLLHLTIAVAAQPLFNSFGAASFIQLVAFSIFEMRYLLLIWKAQRPAAFAEGFDAMRRELSILYSRFYCALVLGMLLLYQFWSVAGFVPLLMVVANSYWVPQIYRSARHDLRYPLHPAYIIGMSLTRMFVPLYAFVCPYSILHIILQLHLRPGLCAVTGAWLALQVAVLLLQDKLGPQFFVPARFLPERYDYARLVTSHAGEPGDEGVPMVGMADEEAGDVRVEDCVICMSELRVVPDEYFVTPCSHFFHQDCLRRWVEIKLECPTCRQPLPPLT